MTTCCGGAIAEALTLVTDVFEVDAALVINHQVTASHTIVGGELVFLNGLLLAQGITNDYTRSGNTITFPTNYIQIGDRITLKYATG
jgi:hypothetical protein